MKCIFTFASGSQVYCLALKSNTVYGGCQDHKIRVWNLNTMQKSHMLIGHEGLVRCLDIRKNMLYSGASDNKASPISRCAPALVHANQTVLWGSGQMLGLADERLLDAVRPAT